MYKFTISTDAAFIASDMFTRWQRGTQKVPGFPLCVKNLRFQLINTVIDLNAP